MEDSMKGTARTWLGVVTAFVVVVAMLALVPTAEGAEPGCDPKIEDCSPPGDNECETNPDHKRCKQPNPECEKDPSLPECDDSTTTTTSSSTTSSSSTSSSTTSSSTTTTTLPETNDPPTLSCPDVTVNTDAAVGTVLGVAEGSDPDGDTLTYEGGDADGLVAVQADGEIQVVAEFPFPFNETTLVVEVTVSDGVNEAVTETCEIPVVEVRPATESVRIYASRAVGHEVWSPDDLPDDVTFDAGNWTVTSGNDDGLFAVDPESGIVTVAADLPRPALQAMGTDRETGYTLEIQVGDPDDVIEVQLAILTVDFFDDDHDSDNASTTPYEDSINWLGDSAVDPWSIAVTSGCTAPDKEAPVYCPEAGTLRGQMAVFVTRMAMIVDESAAWDNDDPTLVTWPDTVGHRFSRWIMALRDAEITVGCNQGAGFCPDRIITWGEASVFIMRAFGPEIDGSTGDGVSQDAALAWLIDSGMTGDLLSADQPAESDTNNDVLRGVMARVLHTVGTAVDATTPG